MSASNSREWSVCVFGPIDAYSAHAIVSRYEIFKVLVFSIRVVGSAILPGGCEGHRTRDECPVSMAGVC